MKNVFTKGTEGIQQQSQHSYFPINEDKSIMVKIIATDTNTNIVSGVKIWDEGNSTFFAWNKYGFSFALDSYAIFRRVGEFNSNPVITPSDYELKTQDAAKVSWICFPINPIIFIEDLGSNQGREVIFDPFAGTFSAGSGPTLDLVQADPVSQYHNLTPPFTLGRIYWGKRVGTKFLCFLPGYGTLEKTFIQVKDGTDYEYTLDWDVDGQGNVLDFRASAIVLTPPLGVGYKFKDWGGAWGTNSIRGSEKRCKTIVVPGGHKCVMKGHSHSQPWHAPHDPLAAEWKVKFYTNYDAWTKIYTNFMAENEHCQFNDYAGEPIYVETAGTGIINKDHFYPSWDIYKDSLAEGALGFVQYIEKGSPVHGDRSSAYAWVAGSSVPIFLYPQWELKGVFWPEYNITTDTPGIYSSGGNHFCVDAGRGDTFLDGYTNWDDHAHIGWNDESIGGWLAYAPHNADPEYEVPGWSGVYASAYCINLGTWVPGYNINGGRVYWSRNHTNWRFKNIPGAWQVGIIGQNIYAYHVADRWKSIRTSAMGYFSDIPPLYQSNDHITLI